MAQAPISRDRAHITFTIDPTDRVLPIVAQWLVECADNEEGMRSWLSMYGLTEAPNPRDVLYAIAATLSAEAGIPNGEIMWKLAERTGMMIAIPPYRGTPKDVSTPKED